MTHACAQTKPKRKTTFQCPDCGAHARITATKILSDTYKEFYVSCSDDECGGRYVFGSEPVRILIPSQNPNKFINLPCHTPAV